LQPRALSLSVPLAPTFPFAVVGNLVVLAHDGASGKKIKVKAA